jgi:signal transduction histidine kinase
MGSRGRSIRLRIYFLVAIPLITMLGLFGYVAYTSVTNFQNLDRAPSLIQATSEPLTNFVSLLQAERRAAIVYESAPTAANLAAFQSAVTATKNGLGTFEGVVNSAATTSNATPAETAALTKMVNDVTGMSGLRTEVTANKLSPIATLQAYSEIVADQDTVFQAQAASMTDTVASSQGLGLISTINAREDVSEQDAVLAGALAAKSLTGPDRAAFGLAYGRQFDDTQLYEKLLTPAELQQFNTAFNQLASPTEIQANLTKIQEAVTADIPLSAMEAQGLSSGTWQLLTSTWQKANYTAATDTADSTLGSLTGLATSAKNRIWEVGGVGLAGLILTLIVSLLLSRSINRRLNTLRRSALTLAQEQLPSVVARLRRGESVDVAAEAPPIRVGGDEIGQVGQAIDTVRQTAIRSAIDEARVRQGVNDMFRNLARRNQSLLQRQLTVLDEAERRTTDPDILEDLFKMDHLTTRMRRHAEGLIILSGAPPGRSWSAPVKLIDVMRGAVSEVEDYARVSVSTHARAALAGSAVTDVIHLLAELIENATTLSPPFTQVRVSGEIVANGFAIEIEDRGLGLTPQRLHELNERLANPPDINPANTEQLGLFVVGQLARRHGLQVMLRPSPYGGTTAVTLIPLALIVEDGPAAITSGARVPVTADAGPASGGSPYSNGSPYGNGSTYNGPSNGGHGNGANGSRAGGAWPGPARAAGGTGTASRPAAAAGRAATPASGYAPEAPETLDPGRSSIRIGGYSTGGYAAGGGLGPDSAPTQSGLPGTPGATGGRRGRHGTDDDVPVVTGVPITRTTAAQPATPFDVFTPRRKSAQDVPPPAETAYQQSYPDHQPSYLDRQQAHPDRQQSYPDFGAQQDTPYVSPYADSPYADPESSPYGDPNSPSYQGDGVAYDATGSYGSTANIETNGDSEAGYQDGDSAGGATDGALPRRVRQASLAPQLRATTTAGSPGPAAVPQASAASLTDMRNTLSAMQRGWQQGRSQARRDDEGSGDGE